MLAIWIVCVVFALVFAAILSGAALGRLLDRIYIARLRSRAGRLLRQRSRDELLAEVDSELASLREQREAILAEIERARTGRLALDRQRVFEEICRAEAWRDAIEAA